MGCSGLVPRIPFYTPLFWGLAQKAYAWMGSSGRGPRILCGWDLCTSARNPIGAHPLFWGLAQKACSLMVCSGLGPRIPFYTPLFWGLAQKACSLMGSSGRGPRIPFYTPPILGPRPEGMLLDGFFWARAQNPLLYPPPILGPRPEGIRLDG